MLAARRRCGRSGDMLGRTRASFCPHNLAWRGLCCHSVLAVLALRGRGYSGFVVGALVKLLCRVTQLSWQSDARHRMTVDDIAEFFQVCAGPRRGRQPPCA